MLKKIFSKIFLFCLILLHTGYVYSGEIEGVWIIEKKSGEVLTIEFSGQDDRFSLSGPDEWYEGIYTTQPHAEPKYLDLHITNCSNPAHIGKTALYIYKLDDDILTLAGNEPGDISRPVSFNESDDTCQYVFIGINYDSSDDDDDDDNEVRFSLHANCFISHLLNSLNNN